MSYAARLLVLSITLFLTLIVAYIFGWMAWLLFEAGRFNFFTVMLPLLCLLSLYWAWYLTYLILCQLLLEGTEKDEDTTPHTILGPGGDFTKEYRE